MLADKVEEILNENRLALTIGGCHSIAIGSLTGVGRKFGGENVAVLWIDAHVDLNTNTTSPSGNMHGMPVSLITNELRSSWPTISELAWCQPQLSLKNFCWIGLRSVDYYERLMMEKYGIKYYDMRDVDKMGIDKVTNEALKAINPDGKKKLHLSFDIDALDPIHAASTGTPVPGGLTLREGIYLVEEVYRTGMLSSMDIVEINPHLGNEKDVINTLDSAKAIILAAMGNNRSGNIH